MMNDSLAALDAGSRGRVVRVRTISHGHTVIPIQILRRELARWDDTSILIGLTKLLKLYPPNSATADRSGGSSGREEGGPARAALFLLPNPGPDSNRQPWAYEAPALSVELPGHPRSLTRSEP